MTRPPVETPYTVRSIQAMLGISRGVVMGLVKAGFVKPARGPRNELRFSFRDVVLLRTAHGLRSAHVAPRRIASSLRKLRASLPEELPLTGLRITAVGNTVVVHEGGARWEPESGQLAMDLDFAHAEGTLAVLPHRDAAVPLQRAGAVPTSGLEHPEPEPPAAAQWFARGQQLEEGDAAAAERAYRKALASEPGYADASLNLGALLCDAGRCDEAVRLYERAIAHSPRVAELHYNLAVALEDLGRIEAALASYDRCLALDPRFADAHFNAARLHDELGDAQKALRHFSAYRRLQR